MRTAEKQGIKYQSDLSWKKNSYASFHNMLLRGTSTSLHLVVVIFTNVISFIKLCNNSSQKGK